MRKTLFILLLALMLGVAGASLVSAQPQRLGTAQAGEQPRLQRPAFTPEQRDERRATMCQNMNARSAGRLAYLETRMELTAGQRAAFNRWRDVRLAAAKRRAATSATTPMGHGGRGLGAQTAQVNPTERMARQEQMLRQRLADITAERPALDALYASLTPEQRQKFTPSNGPRNGMGRANQRARIGMMRDRMDGGPRGPMGGGMRRGPGGPGMAPPPPPPQ